MVREVIDIVLVLLIAVAFFLILILLTGPVKVDAPTYVPEPNIAEVNELVEQQLKRLPYDETLADGLDEISLQLKTQRSLANESVQEVKK